MRAIHRLYTLGVLWLLSVIGQDAVERIYRHGHEDGANELREWMRRELHAVHVATIADRLRHYNRGYREAIRFVEGDDEPAVETPTERVM